MQPAVFWIIAFLTYVIFRYKMQARQGKALGLT